MNIKKLIKLHCVNNDITIEEFTALVNISSRQLMYYHINKKTPEVLSKIEEILDLEKGALLNNNM